MAKPDIQIAAIVYNHKPFLRECIESILKQKTQYSFEILVFEDCSTDGSQDLLRAIAAENPGRIRLFLNETNKGHLRNWRDRIPLLTSEFFASIDGDDRWLDDQKIEKSVSFLQEHPDFVCYAQNVEIFEDGKTRVMHSKPFPSDRHTVENFIADGIYHHTSSLVYRNVFDGKFPSVYDHPSTGDWFFLILHTQHGDLHYDPTVGSRYRVHSTGLWSKLTNLQQAMLNLDSAYTYNQLLERKYERSFSRHFFRCAKTILRLIYRRQSPAMIFKYIILLGTYPIGPMRFLPFRFANERMFEWFKTRVRVEM